MEMEYQFFVCYLNNRPRIQRVFSSTLNISSTKTLAFQSRYFFFLHFESRYRSENREEGNRYFTTRLLKIEIS